MSKNKSILFLFGFFLILCTVLSACDATETVPEDNELLIGIALPQTGTLGSAGQLLTSGIHLALRKFEATLPDLDIALVVIDTRSTTEGAADAYRRLAEMDNLPVVIGPLTSAATEAVIPVLREVDVVSLGPTSSKAGLSAQRENLFRSSLADIFVVPSGIRTSKANLNFKSVATLHNSLDAFAIAANKLIVDELKTYSDVTIARQESYSRPVGTRLSEGDVADQLQNILSATPPVDAIFLSGLPEDHVTILPVAYRRNNSATFIVNFLAISEVRTINELEPGAAEGAVTFSTWLSSSTNTLSQAFVKDYTQVFGEVPDDWTARGYVSATVLIEALSRSSAYDSESIRESLSSIKDFPTIFGSFTFNSDGDAIYDPVVAVVKDNNFTAWPIVSK